MSDEAEVYGALVLGTRDYLRKTGFKKALIALSGGIDSSLVAAIAVDAIGAENVHGVSMPSRYSSEGSIKDAKELAENLGIEFRIIPIEPAHAAFEEMLASAFEGTQPGIAEENLQSRIRGERDPGAVEQVWLDRADDREQERAGDGIRDAGGRHGRRVRGDQGRAEDDGLPAVRAGETRRASGRSSRRR